MKENSEFSNPGRQNLLVWDYMVELLEENPERKANSTSEFRNLCVASHSCPWNNLFIENVSRSFRQIP